MMEYCLTADMIPMVIPMTMDHKVLRRASLKVVGNLLNISVDTGCFVDVYKRQTVMKWFDDSARKWNRSLLFDAVWQGDSDTITREMNPLLRKTISYHDYREDFYHAFLAGIFAGAGYLVESNKEHGEGRSDVVVSDPLNSRVAVFEAKYSRTLENMDISCQEALRQIDSQMYASEFEDSYDHVFCYGISFFKKRCLIQKK